MSEQAGELFVLDKSARSGPPPAESTSVRSPSLKLFSSLLLSIGSINGMVAETPATTLLLGVGIGNVQVYSAIAGDMERGAAVNIASTTSSEPHDFAGLDRATGDVADDDVTTSSSNEGIDIFSKTSANTKIFLVC